ncbi:MAG: AI-2E family transporter, partial [Chitinophagaceae bacterium]
MQQLPLTVRRALELIGLYFLGMIIIAGKSVLTPLLMAFFISIVLLPVYRFFRKRKFPEVLSIALTILLLIILIGSIVWFFASQVGRLMTDFPQIKENVLLHMQSLGEWINSKTNFSTDKQLALINKQSSTMLDSAGGLLSGAAGSITGTLVFIALLPLYIFLILFYRNLLLRFVFLWFPQQNHAQVEDVMSQTQIIIKSYLIGLLIQIAYITVLLGGILMIIGIKHALLIGAIFAVLNLIPYVGALIGNLIGVLLTLTSSQELWP